MKTRMIGSQKVSEIGMGCMAFSHGYGAVPDEAYSVEAILRAHDVGCTFFDTAEIYGSQAFFYVGHNEELLGKATESFRKDVVLATKYMPKLEDAEGEGGLYGTIRARAEASMKRLRTDYIDLYYLHRVHKQISVEEVGQVMGRLEKEGLIRGWGLSQVDAVMLARAHAVTPVAAVQNLYNIMERDCEQDVIPYCLDHQIAVVPFSPVASGYLSGKVTVDTEYEKVDDVRNWVPQMSKENVAANQPILDVLGGFADKKGATKAQISIAWMLHKYPNIIPIPGSKNQERILENLGASNIVLTDEEFKALEAALDACEVHGHRGQVQFVG
ncbi:MAG: aldo/keto reductase [Clostridiales bacterium]|jgi:aryl-alcohol dehydrogenase-like predicted oxidoreductase|nr:aldo/keto reductase [Clostridiales bacterium]